MEALQRRPHVLRPRPRAYFSQLEDRNADSRAVKEAIVVEAEELSTSTSGARPPPPTGS